MKKQENLLNTDEELTAKAYDLQEKGILTADERASFVVNINNGPNPGRSARGRAGGSLQSCMDNQITTTLVNT